MSELEKEEKYKNFITAAEELGWRTLFFIDGEGVPHSGFVGGPKEIEMFKNVMKFEMDQFNTDIKH